MLRQIFQRAVSIQGGRLGFLRNSAACYCTKEGDTEQRESSYDAFRDEYQTDHPRGDRPGEVSFCNVTLLGRVGNKRPTKDGSSYFLTVLVNPDRRRAEDNVVDGYLVFPVGQMLRDKVERFNVGDRVFVHGLLAPRDGSLLVFADTLKMLNRAMRNRQKFEEHQE